MSEPYDLNAVELRRLIGTGQLSPVDLVDGCIRRIEALNPLLNAIVNFCPERARSEAVAAERAVARGDELGSLHGLPLGVKDLNHVAGIRTTFGSPLFADFVPAADEGVVARMREAGAIVVGKTNVPEHGFGATTLNPLYGATNNPFAPGMSAGASSGGSAVALASGMVPLAMGSDFAGSLRTPASFCGISGFRPSPGTVAQSRRTFAFSPFDVEGPMGRSVADCKLLLSAMTGREVRDPLSRAPDPAMRETPRTIDLTGLKVGVSEDLGFAPVSKEVRRTFRGKLAAFSSSFLACEDDAPDATLRCLIERDLCARARMIETWFTSHRSLLCASALTRELRGAGAMFGLELCSVGNVSPGEVARLVRLDALQRGLLTWECGTRSEVIGMMPPLIASRRDVADACGRLRAALSAVETELLGEPALRESVRHRGRMR